MAQRNLETETPTKNFCKQFDKSKKKIKLPKKLELSPPKNNMKHLFAKRKSKLKLETSMQTFTIINPHPLTRKK